MGKSMSTAKNVNRSTIVKTATEKAIQPKPNHETVRRAYPMPDAEYLKKSSTFDNSFNDRLKQVFVTSVNNNPNMDLPKEHPSMPKDRTTPFIFKPHTQTVGDRRPNTLLVDELKEILLNYKQNPEKWTIEYIAARFNITKDIAEKLVTNYSSLEVFFGKTPEKYKKNFPEEEHVPRITYQTSVTEMENIVTQGVKKKYKTFEEAMRDEFDMKK